MPEEILSEKIYTCVEKLGVQGTLQALDEGMRIIERKKYIESFDDTVGEKVGIILNAVAEATGQSVNIIINGKEKTDERKTATSLAVYFIKDNTGLSYREIKGILNKDVSTLSRSYSAAISIIKNGKRRTPYDRTFFEQHDQIQILLLKNLKP